MKTLATIFVSLIALSAQAAPMGQAELVIYPDFGNGVYTTDIRQEGNKILGNTFLGNSGMVNLQVMSGKYQGATGGAGLTSLTCTETSCSGFINSGSTDFKIANGGFQGTINSNLASMKRTAKGIEINTINGHMNLAMTSAGNYEGTGSISGNINSQFHATLKTSGTLADFKDTALAAIFLAAPLAGN